MTQDNPKPNAIAARIARYLETADGQARQAMLLPLGPMVRPVGIYRSTWHKWFARLDNHRGVALRTLDLLGDNAGQVPRGTHVVTRPDLERLAGSRSTPD